MFDRKKIDHTLLIQSNILFCNLIYNKKRENNDYWLDKGPVFSSIVFQISDSRLYTFLSDSKHSFQIPYLPILLYNTFSSKDFLFRRKEPLHLTQGLKNDTLVLDVTIFRSPNIFLAQTYSTSGQFNSAQPKKS